MSANSLIPWIGPGARPGAGLKKVVSNISIAWSQFSVFDRHLQQQKCLIGRNDPFGVVMNKFYSLASRSLKMPKKLQIVDVSGFVSVVDN